jgi:DNA invertase Pin-like site-specific DNA recombinase
MSTEDQQYSIANQKAALEVYAANHGLEIVREYADAGKSGLVLRYRTALKQLLQDVVQENVPYKAILVYDVSRWGRFLDADEAAYYEFLCKQAGIPIHYCAEPFANNDTLPNAMFKTMKRIMAAEYSRELSRKVSDGLRRLNALGFRTTGTAGYGLRRMLISQDGHKKQILKDGEWKNLKTDRVILIPGPQNEVACVRDIFASYGNKRMGVTKIVRGLNKRKIPRGDSGRPWTTSTVSRMLQNPKYIGTNRWGRTTAQLKMQSQHVIPETNWVIKENAFEPIVDKELFERVQRRFAARATRYHYTEHRLLDKLKRLARKGRITQELINSTSGPKTSGRAIRWWDTTRHRTVRKDMPDVASHGSSHGPPQHRSINSSPTTFKPCGGLERAVFRF